MIEAFLAPFRYPFMLEAMGVITGISLDRLLDAVEYVRDNVNGKLTGSMLNACRGGEGRGK